MTLLLSKRRESVYFYMELFLRIVKKTTNEIVTKTTNFNSKFQQGKQKLRKLYN